MKHPEASEFTADDFIAWALEQPAGRYELRDGRVVAMAPERAGHAVAKANVHIALHSAIKARGLACRAFTDGMAVRIDDRTVYEPDAFVRCGPPLPRDAVEATDPLVIVEVVSPSSGAIDRGAKLAGYFLLPSLRHYLVVDTENALVTHHRRSETGDIVARTVRDGTLVLDPPGIEIEVPAIFDEA